MSVQFDFDRLTRTYCPGDEIKVKLTVHASEPIKPKEVYCNVYCVRTIEIRGHNLAGFDSIIPRTPENVLWYQPVPLPSPIPAKLDDGWGFNFSFKVPVQKNLTESLRGKYVSVDYYIEFLIKRGLLQSDIVGMRSFFIVNKGVESVPKGKPVEMIMDKKNLKKGSKPLDFKAIIRLNSDTFSFLRPPNGSIEVAESKSPVSAITVSYIRTEKIATDKAAPQTLVSEVCRMQIAENDPPLKVEFPFNMEWVRILVSPDVETPLFSMSFGLKVRIIFDNGSYAIGIVPLKTFRDLAY